MEGANDGYFAIRMKSDIITWPTEADGNWTERRDVRNVRVMGSGTGPMRVFNNEWMTIKGKAIGPEIGIGHQGLISFSFF